MHRIIASCCLTLALASVASADVTMPPIFSEHMVVQQATTLPVWGKAEPGEQVTVTLADRTGTATAGDDGKWTVTLEPVTEAGPHTLTIKGNNTIEIPDVLAGEVWLCGGQSNMQWPIDWTPYEQSEAPFADLPKLRVFKAEYAIADEPTGQVKGKWTLSNAENFVPYSAAAYFFGKDLQLATGGPVGIVQSAKGGSNIESWLPKERMEKLPQGVKFNADYQQDTVLHNAMIDGLLPYAVRGFAWYQGESNAGSPDLYFARLESLIDLWRQGFAGPEKQPFIVIQLAAYKSRSIEPEGGQDWTGLRAAQQEAADKIDGVSMVCTIDIGDPNDIHPRNKQAVGRRMALLALRDAYGKDVVAEGPKPARLEVVEGKTLRLTFDTPITLADETEYAFAIQNDDNDKWSWARVIKVDSQTLMVSADAMKGKPKAVRYAWQMNPPSVLSNEAGLPAPPFVIEVSK